MRKILLFILTVIMIFSITGCKDQEIKSLREQADKYYSSGDLDNSIKMYTKILELRESLEDRKVLDDLIIEQKSVEVTKKFLKVMDEFRYKIDAIHNMVELSEYMMSIKTNFDELEKCDTTKDTEISKFIKNLIGRKSYIRLKEEYNEDYMKNAQSDADRAIALDTILGAPNVTATNSIFFEWVIKDIGNKLKDIPKNLPNKYN